MVVCGYRGRSLQQQPRVTDEQTFRDFVEWTAKLTDWQLENYDWWAHRANARNLLDVSRGGRLYAGDDSVPACTPSWCFSTVSTRRPAA